MPCGSALSRFCTRSSPHTSQPSSPGPSPVDDTPVACVAQIKLGIGRRLRLRLMPHPSSPSGSPSTSRTNVPASLPSRLSLFLSLSLSLSSLAVSSSSLNCLRSLSLWAQKLPLPSWSARLALETSCAALLSSAPACLLSHSSRPVPSRSLSLSSHLSLTSYVE